MIQREVMKTQEKDGGMWDFYMSSHSEALRHVVRDHGVAALAEDRAVATSHGRAAQEESP